MNYLIPIGGSINSGAPPVSRTQLLLTAELPPSPCLLTLWGRSGNAVGHDGRSGHSAAEGSAFLPMLPACGESMLSADFSSLWPIPNFRSHYGTHYGWLARHTRSTRKACQDRRVSPREVRYLPPPRGLHCTIRTPVGRVAATGSWPCRGALPINESYCLPPPPHHHHAPAAPDHAVLITTPRRRPWCVPARANHERTSLWGMKGIASWGFTRDIVNPTAMDQRASFAPYSAPEALPDPDLLLSREIHDATMIHKVS